MSVHNLGANMTASALELKTESRRSWWLPVWSRSNKEVSREAKHARAHLASREEGEVSTTRRSISSCFLSNYHHRGRAPPFPKPFNRILRHEDRGAYP